MGKYGKIVEGIQNQQAAPLLRCSLERNTRPSVGNLYLPKDVAGWVGPSKFFWSVMYQSNGKSSGARWCPLDS